ncbi:MliC family protein [Vibrio sp. TH_r3]|uniref:MliC family protein n=1 Tax=Vibrio sp. TH_r3 TaxID=3082084 RepID=UPI0029554A60|nr:MliC family protein [Vibrio sp. TH_r3]MDV7104777.1 MliC family protein [Vibrio sp. TH_r3]
MKYYGFGLVAFLLLSGCSAKKPETPLYLCDNGSQFSFSQTGELTAEMLMSKKRIPLQQIPAASGSKYKSTDQALQLWLKGSDAMLTLGSEAFVNCTTDY